jgi:hypothetical protein
VTATRAEEAFPLADARTAERDRRYARLSSRVGSLRSRARSTGDKDRYLLVAGSVLVPLGLLLVVLGWVGASGTVLLFEQLPYIVSGGLLGLALVVAGGFVYWSYWQTLLVREARLDRAELTAGLTRLEALLEQALEARLQAPGAPPAAPPVDLVVTARGTMLHRSDCSVVAGREGLRPAAADTPGLQPCRLCDPLSA